MNCAFTYIKLKHSESVEEHAQDLINKLSKFFDRPLKGHFTFAQEKFNHRATLTLTGKDIYFKAEATDENFYTAIENAVDKMHRQLLKKKGKMKHHKQKHPAKELNTNIIYLEDYRRAMELRRKSS